MHYTLPNMTRRGDHKRTRVIKVLLTDPEFDELTRLCRSSGLGTFSEVVRRALFESGLHRTQTANRAVADPVRAEASHG